jgi:hypothetical protein
MKKLIYTALLTLTGLSASAQQSKGINLENFSGLSVSGAASVKYRVSDTNKIILSGNENDFSKVEYAIENSVLMIKTKGTPKEPLRITVLGNPLNNITVSGAASVRGMGLLNTNSLKIDATGAGRVEMNVNNTKTDIIGNGASTVELKGNSKRLHITNTGAATVKTYDLDADTCIIEASGASTTKVTALQKISINATSASTVKFKGDPKEVSAEGGIASKIVRIGDDDSMRSLNPNDSTTNKTTFRYKNKQIIIIEGGHDGKDTVKHSKNDDLTRKHWQGLWMGFAGYTNPAMGFSMNKPYEFMSLDYARSYNFQWNLGQKNFNLYKKYIQLSTGVGLQFNNLKFEYNTRLNADSAFTWGNIDSSNTFNYRKNRFKQTYVTVPLLLNFNSSKSLKHNLHFTAGVVGKYLLNSRTKTVLTRVSDEYTFRRKDSYNLNPFQVDAYASIGYRNFTIYAQYALTEMFKKGQGAQLYPFSAGIRLISFD